MRPFRRSSFIASLLSRRCDELLHVRDKAECLPVPHEQTDSTLGVVDVGCSGMIDGVIAAILPGHFLRKYFEVFGDLVDLGFVAA